MCGGGKKSETKQQCCITCDDEGQCCGIVICETQCGICPCKICAKDNDGVNATAKWLRARPFGAPPFRTACLRTSLSELRLRSNIG